MKKPFRTGQSVSIKGDTYKVRYVNKSSKLSCVYHVGLKRLHDGKLFGGCYDIIEEKFSLMVPFGTEEK